MKIVCDACQTKYSIADERVAGKVFKIRCKKCSQIIVVRGTAVEPVDTPAEAPAGDWHVVIDGQQSGPFDRAELVRRHAAGEIDDDSFVWRDGMEEWAAFGSIGELAEGTTRTAPVEEPAAQDAMFSTQAADAFTSNAFSGGEVAKAADDKKLLAERNENSVLFTLGNLAKLASDSRPVAKDTAPAKSGAAGGEGSGLIDIRALASTFGKPAAAKTSTAVGSLDDLPTFGPTTFGEPIVLMPAARQKTDRKMLYALFAALAMLAIIGTVLIVVVVRGGKDDDTQASKDRPGTRVATLGNTDPRAGDDASGTRGTDASATSASDTTASGTAASSANGTTTSGTNASTATGTTASGTSGTTASGTNASGANGTTASVPNVSSTRPNTSTTRPNTSTTRPNTSSTTASRPNTTTSTATTTTRPNTTSTTTTRPSITPPPTPTTNKPDRVQCEFSNFADKGCEIYKPATSTTANSNLPDNLDRGAIAAGLGTIKAQVCGNKSSSRGDVAVQIKVNADGGVSGVTVKSSPDQALSSCVVAAAQKGTFAKTKRGASFGYVWRF